MTHKNSAYKQSHTKVPVNVLIAGGLLVDDVAIATESIRPCSSNPVRWEQKLGGVATNVARVVAQQLDCLLIANIGDDKAGDKMTQLLSTLAVPCSAIRWPGETSDRYSAVLNPDGELFVGLADARLVEKMNWQDIQARWPEPSPSAVILDANLSQHCLEETVTAIATQIEPGIKIYAMAVSPIKSQRWLNLADKVEVLFCNRREAAALTSMPEQTITDALADSLLHCGFKQFVITDANHPVLVQEHKTRSHIPPPKAKIEQNVNGAGDALAGATIAQVVLGHSLPHAIASAGLDAAQAVLQGDRIPPAL